MIPSSVNLTESAVLLAGPTAVGKSDVAMELATRLGGEIIAVDSMQVYRGLDIGTAKPGASDQARIRHHLLDVLDLREGFDAVHFLGLACKALESIRLRGKKPIFCGGTGLYFKALLQGVGEAPPRDDGLRKQLEARPLPDLLEELRQRDPETFDRIDRMNARRVVRALEIVLLTGQSASRLRSAWNAEAGGNHPFFFGLRRSREDLNRRIDERVEAMFREGLVEETRRLLDQGLGGNPTAMQAIGYRQVVEYLDGARSLEETVELIKLRTRQFARRQMTWFRRQVALRWVEVEPGESCGRVVERILDFMKGFAE